LAIKKIILLGSLALVIAFVTGLLIVLHPMTGPGYNSVTLDCPLPNVPPSITRLKVVYQDVAAEEIRGLAEGIFGFTGYIGEIENSSYSGENDVGGLLIENSGQELWLFRSGSIAYTTGEGGPSFVIPENLPSYERAEEIAENFIQMIEANGLVPENISIRFDSVDPGAITVVGNTQIVNYLIASFHPVFGGIKMYGSDVHVTIGENGKILAFGGMWRRVIENGYATITVTPEEALNILKSGRFSPFHGIFGRNVTIKSMELAYYSTSAFDIQDNLPLVYLFGVVGSEGTFYHEIVPATDELFPPLPVPS
jgi:hypothetical protein